MDDLISREEATSIPILPKEHRKIFKSIDDAFETGWNEALSCVNMLPSAQPQACDDAISREDAKWVVFCNRDHVEDQTNAIDSLPCVQSPHIKSRWERKESDLSWWYECSECGESPLFDPYEHEVRTPFCPWCGADMRQGDSGDAPNRPE